MSNPHPAYRCPKIHKEEMAKDITGVRLPVDIDAYVRKKPNRSEWLRKVISDAVKQEMESPQSLSK